MAAAYPVVTSPEGNLGESSFDGARITRTPAGTIVEGIGPVDAGPRIPQQGDHFENLAEYMDTGERRSLALRLLEYVEADKESRSDWQEREKRGYALMGIDASVPDEKEGESAVNGPGLAQVKIPVILEASVNFQARSIAEIFPATGPVKVTVTGERTRDVIAQAQRVEDFGNYYLTQEDAGYFPDTDQMLLYLPMSGSAFRKAGQDWVTGMPRMRYIKATNFVVPYSATDLETAERYAHLYTMTGQDLRRAMESGMFSDIPLIAPSPGEVQHAPISDKSDGRVAFSHEDDKLHDIVEYHINLELEVDEEATPTDIDSSWSMLPYIVIIDRTNSEVLMIRRNWPEKDPKRTKLLWFAHHKFFPGLGFYGWGYPHVIGSLQIAINDTTNALLDSGFANNFIGGFITKEGRASGLGGEIVYEPGKFKQLDGSFEELQKAIWTPDLNPPSPALANLATELLSIGRRFASITEVATGDGDNRGPVGTTVALIEQSNVVPTSIHKRLHQSFGQEFKMWAKLTHEFMPDVYPYKLKGEEQQLLKQDFDDRIDVVPVSDPNIWSQTQRIALAQGTLELQAQAPDLYPPAQRAAAHRRMLEAMRVPDIDEVGPVVETPRYLDPVAEGQAMLMGQAVKAFETQDHQAHIAIHGNQRLTMLGSPAFMMMEPQRQQMVLSAFDAHMCDHMGLAYRRQIMQTAGIPLPPMEPGAPPPELPPEIEAKLSAAVAMKLPPPPPPADGSGGDNGQAEAAALQAKTQAQIQAKAQESEASIVRDTKAFAAEERRKEIAFANELSRKERQARLDASIKLQQAKLDEQRKDDTTSAQIVREGAKSKLQMRTQTALARQKMQHGDAAVNQKLEHADKTVEKTLEHKDKVVEKDLEHKGKAAKQTRAHLEQDHELLVKQSQDDHQSEQKRADESHQAEQRRADDSHEREQKRTSQTHRQSMKQTGEAGKLKITQAKEQARARKKSAGAKKS